jgi:hypothetical protein
MTRTDVMASSRPGTTGSRTTGRTKAPRGLLALPIIALVMAFALLSPAGALAAEETSSYGQTTTAPTTTHETEPTKTSTTPTTTPTTTTPTAEPAKTLPFTGFDLRWSFAIGLLLILAGFGIVVAQRRRANER